MKRLQGVSNVRCLGSKNQPTPSLLKDMSLYGRSLPSCTHVKVDTRLRETNTSSFRRVRVFLLDLFSPQTEGLMALILATFCCENRYHEAMQAIKRFLAAKEACLSLRDSTRTETTYRHSENLHSDKGITYKPLPASLLCRKATAILNNILDKERNCALAAHRSRLG